MGALEGKKSLLLEDLPAELIIEIMKNIPVSNLSSLALSSRRLYDIFTINQTVIMLSVIRNQPELEILLLYHTRKLSDFQPGRMLHPRTIHFDTEQENVKKIRLMYSKVEWIERRLICPEKITFKLKDIYAIWKLMKLIDWWVEMYPVFKWRENPIDRRTLCQREESRLRKGVARWLLYSYYFHGVYFRDLSVPRILQEDDRLHHLRVMSTTEIRELEDLWGTIYDIVSKEICASPAQMVHDDDEYAVDLLGWGLDEGRHSAIVNTYLKLDPIELKHYVEKRSQMKKRDVIKNISSEKPNFTLDRETLSSAIDTVLQERVLLQPKHSDVPKSGILDEDRAEDSELEVWANDAWASGKVPVEDMHKSVLEHHFHARFQRVANGDDGTDVAAHHRRGY